MSESKKQKTLDIFVKLLVKLKKAELLAYVRFKYDHNKIQREFLFFEELTTNTTAEAIFSKLNTFLAENKIFWSRCVGICVDGCQIKMGKRDGFMAKVQKEHPYIKFTHCMIHREALSVKYMPEELKKVFTRR